MPSETIFSVGDGPRSCGGADEDEEDDEDEEEEEEFKIIIETKNKQRLVLCTVEGVSCAMLQNPPYFNPNRKQTENDEEEANGGGNIADDEKQTED